MPIIKSAIRQMKNNRVRQARNRHFASRMKSMMKLFMEYVDANELEKAKKVLPEVVKAVDTAAKKNLIHPNNAANKKSRIQRTLNHAEKNPKTDVAPAKKTSKKKAK